MAMNRVQFQPGLSMPEFLERYGSDDQCEAALGGLALARWLYLPCVRLGREQLVSARGTAVLPVQRFTLTTYSVISGTVFEVTKSAAYPLVPRHAPAHSVEE